MNTQRLEKPRARRDAAKILGIALQSRYRRLLEATGEDEIVVATGDLAQTMYENVEFIIWALKHLGGLNPPPPEVLRPTTPPKPAGFINPHAPNAADKLAEDMGAFVCAFCHKGPGHADDCPTVPKPVELPCTCEVLEHGIIGRDKHMTSCPKFVPA